MGGTTVTTPDGHVWMVRRRWARRDTALRRFLDRRRAFRRMLWIRRGKRLDLDMVGPTSQSWVADIEMAQDVVVLLCAIVSWPPSPGWGCSAGSSPPGWHLRCRTWVRYSAAWPPRPWRWRPACWSAVPGWSRRSSGASTRRGGSGASTGGGEAAGRCARSWPRSGRAVSTSSRRARSPRTPDRPRPGPRDSRVRGVSPAEPGNPQDAPPPPPPPPPHRTGADRAA
jgi:hypothetical protein